MSPRCDPWLCPGPEVQHEYAARRSAQYLQLRRSLGFKLKDAGLQLPRFVAFVEQHGSTHITNALALAWAQQSQSVQPAEWARRLSYVRGFARHRRATDTQTEVPPLGLLPHRSTRAQPYLYSDEEVEQLLAAALKLPTSWHRTPLRPWIFHCLFGLLAATGLRISEALNLQIADVDLGQALLTIRGAKLGKTRLVPLHASTNEVLADYLRRRRECFAWSISPYVLSRARAIGSIRPKRIGPSTRYRGRSACAVRTPAMGRASTTCGIVSQSGC